MTKKHQYIKKKTFKNNSRYVNQVLNGGAGPNPSIVETAPEGDIVFTLPSNTLVLGDNWSKNKKKFTQINFGASRVLEIGTGAFLKSNLSSITIQNSVVKIGDSVFKDCLSLKSVTFEPNMRLDTITKFMFKGSGITSIIIPNSVMVINQDAFRNCKSLKNVEFSPGANRLSSINEFAFKDSGLETIELPNNLRSIGRGAFSYCEKLSSIVLPISLESIGKQAFENCNLLRTITIPINVDKIDEKAFSGCINLEEVIVITRQSGQSMRIVDNDIFEGCVKLLNKEDILRKLRIVPQPPLITIVTKNKNSEYIEEESKKKELLHQLLVNVRVLKEIEPIRPLHEGYLTMCELMHGFNNPRYNILRSLIINNKPRIRGETLIINKSNPSLSLTRLLTYLNTNNNINKCVYVNFEGSRGINESGLSRALCEFMGKHIKKIYMKNLFQEICKEEAKVEAKAEAKVETKAEAKAETKDEAKAEDIDKNKKIINVNYLKTHPTEIDNLSKLLYYFMFTMSPLKEGYDYHLSIYLSDFTLMMIFGMFEKIGENIKLSKFIQNNVIDILENDDKPGKKYINNDTEYYELADITPNKEDVESKKYRKDIDNKILHYIGILFSLDEMNITKDYLKPFVTNFTTNNVIPLPMETLLHLLYRHLYGEVIIDTRNLLQLYKDVKHDIEILETMHDKIKELLQCMGDTCFTNDDSKVTLYELSTALIQPNFNIDKEKFINMIRYYREINNPNLIESRKTIIDIFNNLDDNQIRFLFRYVTGNILMPSKFDIFFGGDEPDSFVSHTCGKYVAIWTFQDYINKVKIAYDEKIRHINNVRARGNRIENEPPYVEPTIEQYKETLKDKILAKLEFNDFDIAGGSSSSSNINKSKKTHKTHKTNNKTNNKTHRKNNKQ